MIPFICAGDPSLDVTVKALRALDDVRAPLLACSAHCCPFKGRGTHCPCPSGPSPQAGADIIELGVPYSDPLADGPVIQAAATRALANGATLDGVLALVRQARFALG